MTFSKGIRVGKIILLNTPIGNLGDLTPRVREALEQGSLFAAEDTRVFKELLNHLGISVQGKRVFALHDQSSGGEVGRLLEMARSETLYVTSDAGSPIVSDPAYPLISQAAKEGIEIESFSGVSSPIMALELSGLPPIPFHFNGFLPRESSKRSKTFLDLAQGTHIFFEAPTRIEETLQELAQVRPELKIALVRELSKKFQQVVRLNASDWPEVKSQVVFKGEFVLLIHQPDKTDSSSRELQAHAQEILAKGTSPKAVAKLLAIILDRPTKDIYSELMRSK
jgi:16S rRNA (cytidine1402-2'-O)-methyltransferase